MKKIIFISGKTKTGNLIREALSNNGFTIITPDLSKMSYYSNEGRTIIKSDNIDVSDATHMMCRTTSDNKRELYRLAVALEGNGCNVIDGVERLKRTVGDKSTSSVERALLDVGNIPTFVPCDDSMPPTPYPCIVKPIDGKFCRGIKVCANYDEYLHAYHENNGNVIVQKYIPFEHECRVLVYNERTPQIVYVASKRNVARKGTKRKATFVPSFVREAMNNIVHLDYVHNRKGIVGYDIGLDSDRKPYIIEANYSPRFDRAVEKLDLDIADKLIKML